MDLANFEAPGTELFCISFVYCFDGKINKWWKKNWAREQRWTTESLLGEVANALSDGISREAVGLIFHRLILRKWGPTLR